MRITSLIILLLIIGAGVAAFIKRDLIQDYFAGFTPAKSPKDALEKFTKAIQARNFRAASKYVTKDYADLLQRGNQANKEMGGMIDRVLNLAKERNFATERVATILFLLDPFPPNVKPAGDPQQVKDRTVGGVVFDVGFKPAVMDLSPYDRAMLAQPFSCVGLPLEIVAEGEGDSKEYRLKVPVPAPSKKIADHYLEKYKPYLEGLDYLRQRLNQSGSFSSKAEFEGELLRKISENR